MAEDYTRSNAYSELLSKHQLFEFGTWEVKGEDPNCDMNGSHVQPHLGFFTGELKDVIDIATALPHFWQWGSGGSITKVIAKSVDEGKRLRELLRRKVKLENELEDVQRQIRELP